MATGKTHPRWLRLLVDEVNLSGDSRQIGSYGSTYEMADITGWSDGIINYNFGRVSHELTGFQAVFNNTASTGSHTELVALENYIVSVCQGIRAEPAEGDPAFLASFEQMSYSVEAGESPLVNADFNIASTDAETEKAFGHVLYFDTAHAASEGSATYIDNGASSANGLLSHLHVFASDGGEWILRVQDSPDFTVWGNVVEYTAIGDVVEVERSLDSGTIDRYIRFFSIRTSGTIGVCVTAVRQ